MSSCQSGRDAVLAHGWQAGSSPSESWLGLGAAPPEHCGHCLDAGVHGCSVFQSWPGASETCFDASPSSDLLGTFASLKQPLPGLSSVTELCSLMQQKRPASLRCLLCPGQGRGACPLRALSVRKPVGRRTLGANVCCALYPGGGEGIAAGDGKGVGSFRVEEPGEVKGLRN